MRLFLARICVCTRAPIRSRSSASTCVCAPNLCETRSTFANISVLWGGEFHPFAVASLVLTKERLLRASRRSSICLAARRGHFDHDAFDRLLPTISQMRAPAPRWFRFRVEACASPVPASLDHLSMNAHERQLAPFTRTRPTNSDRGMSVSRRSSRFGGHPKNALCCRFAGKRCLQSSSEDAEPLMLPSPARFVSVNKYSSNDDSFGPRPRLSALS